MDVHRVGKESSRALVIAMTMLVPGSYCSAQGTGSSAFSGTALAEPGQGMHPDARMDFVLAGVAMRRAASYALISVDGGPDTSYRIGEQLLPGVVLEVVLPQRVAIARNGTREWLTLRGKAAAFHENPVAPSPASSGQKYAVGDAAEGAAGSNGGTAGSDSRRRRGMARQTIRQAIIEARPDGGFQAKRVQPGSAFERMGLRDGDLLLSVNGQPVNSGEELARLYQQVSDNSGELNVEVLRNGTLEELRLVNN